MDERRDRWLYPAIPIPWEAGLGSGVYVVPPYGSCVPAGESAFAFVFVGSSFPVGRPHVNPISDNEDDGYQTYTELTDVRREVGRDTWGIPLTMLVTKSPVEATLTFPQPTISVNSVPDFHELGIGIVTV
jgi:hypothetical protein